MRQFALLRIVSGDEDAKGRTALHAFLGESHAELSISNDRLSTSFSPDTVIEDFGRDSKGMHRVESVVLYYE